MNSLEQYILEKLSLKKGNKNLKTDISAEDFVENIKPDSVKRLVIKLLYHCINNVKRSRKSDHQCYILQSINYPDEYLWSPNFDDEKFNVDDKAEDGYKVVYVVTKKTSLPGKYRIYSYEQ